MTTAEHYSNTWTRLAGGRLVFDAANPDGDRLRLETLGPTTSLELSVTHHATTRSPWTGPRISAVDIALKMHLEYEEGQEGDLYLFGLADGFDTMRDERLRAIANLLGALDLDSPGMGPGTAWGSTLREALALAKGEQ